MQLTPRASRSRRRAPRPSVDQGAEPGDSPASAEGAEGAENGEPAGVEVVDAGRTVAGRASISLSEDSRRMLGVRTEPVRRMNLVHQIRAVGRVARQGPRRASVLVDVYETDLPSVRTGMEAALTVLYLPGKGWRGQVAEIAPAVASKTRTIEVRIEVDNEDGALKPGMFADVFLKTSLGVGLMVPDSAVIFAGPRRLVFVEHDDGRLEPREVRIGPNVGSGFQVLSGLREGEQVVASANFLIDSESSLKGAVAALASGPR